jgi:hypothetical protein
MDSHNRSSDLQVAVSIDIDEEGVGACPLSFGKRPGV